MATDIRGRHALVMQRGVGGSFWQGAAAGAAVSAVIAILLALAFPPRTYLPPEISPETARAPAALESPAPVAGQPAPAADAAAPGLLVAAPAPLLAERPARDVPPALEALARPPAPDVFQGGPAGSPSLYRPSGSGAPELR